MLVNLFNCSFPKFPSSRNGVWYSSSIDPLSTFGRTSSISLSSCEVILLICCWAILCSCDYSGSDFHCLLLLCLFVLRRVAFRFLFCLRTVRYMMKFYMFRFCTKKPITSPFLISIVSSKDLFNISNHKRCQPWENSLIAALLNLDVTYPFELFGKKADIPVSIFCLWLVLFHFFSVTTA